MISYCKRWFLSLFAFALLVAAVIRLDAVPPLWWDEGWTLSVARNWLERGHYGRLLAGQPAPAGLEATFPTTILVALSFRVFGVGVWQGRLAIVFYLMGAMALIYYVARRLYDPSIALATLIVLVCMSGYKELHPIYMGRQVLGELPALFFLLGGYASFLSVPKKPVVALPFAIVFWAMAQVAKLQVVPFWLFAMIIPLIVLFAQRHLLVARRFGIALVGSFLMSRLLVGLWQSLTENKKFVSKDVVGLYDVTALVSTLPSRLFASIVIFLFALPTLLGLLHAFKNLATSESDLSKHEQAVRFSLLVLASSWVVWYVTLSASTIRYLFPAVFISSMFVAAMLSHLTKHFSVSFTLREITHFIGGGFTKQAFGVTVAVLLVLTSVPRTGFELYEAYIWDAESSVLDTAQFLNTQTPHGSVVETYDSQLFFLLDRPYHYPPDQVHVQLIRTTRLFGDQAPIGYDPLAANPDFIVVGPHSKFWHLYDSVLRTGSFRLLREFRKYKIYERLR